MRRTTTLTAAGLLGLTLLAPAYAATAAGETCRGEAATIVGTTPTVTGTEGRDVIVSGRAASVDGLGGDDLVCVAPDGVNFNLLSVDAGAGDDVVDTSAAARGYYVTTDLGAGADTLLGGDADDTVRTGPEDARGMDTDTDGVRTGGGADSVTTGAPGAPNHDVVDAGDGDDRVTLVTWSTAVDGRVAGGGGTDTLLTTSAPVSAEMTADMAAGYVDGVADHPVVAHFSSFEGLHVELADEVLTYRGTAGEDVLEVSTRASGALPRLYADTFGGDDELRLKEATFAGPGRIDLGVGDDRVVAARSTRSLVLDLKRGALSSPDGTIAAAGIESAFLMAPRGAVVGDNRDNLLAFNGCKVVLRGGHGDDHLTHVSGDPWWEEFEFGCKGRVKAYGGPGEDRIRGGQGRDRLFGDGDRDRLEGRGGNDVLVGGRGRDRADAGEGRDRCSAERERRCER